MTALDLKFFSRSQVPVLLQTEAAECGLACLAMVAGFHGYNTDLGQLRRRWSVSLKGLSLAQLVEMARDLKLMPRAVKLDLEDVSQLQTPCILHWQMDHFVVLEDVQRNGTLVIIDPAIGRRRIDSKQASKDFTGVALELTPTQEFQPQKTITTLKLRDFFANTRNLIPTLSQILLLSLALQVFALIAPFYSQLVIDDVVQSGDRELLHILALCFAALAIINGLVTLFRSWVVLYLGTKLKYSWAASLFRHLIRLPLSYFEKRHIGDIQSRFASINAVQELVTTKVVEAVVDGLMAITTVTVMFVYDATLALVVIASLILYLLVRLTVFPYLRLKSNEAIIAKANKESFFLESIRGLLAIKSFGREQQRESSLQNKLAEELNAGVYIGRLEIWQGTANQLIFALQNVLVLWIAATAILDGGFSVGMLLAFIAYKTQFTQRASALIDKLIEYRLISIHLGRLEDIVGTEPEQDSNELPSLALSTQTMRGEIELRDLWFRYADNEPFVLQGVNLHIKAGEHVAIVGPSGFGKTTLLKVLMGLLEPTRGEVFVDGQPLAHYGIQNYRRQSAAVMQDDQLLSGTLADNIAFFDAQIDFEQVAACARWAAIEKDILVMPMRYYTLVGDMGAALSGGQKQRILLARALYKNPRILFLDEATSHLDQENEQQVNNALKRLGITRVTIAHREETIRSVDRVIDLTQQHAQHQETLYDQLTEDEITKPFQIIDPDTAERYAKQLN